MSKLPRRLSGIEVVKVLCNKFGFKIINRKGSHITLIDESKEDPTPLIVVAHKEVRKGTLREIITNSGVGREAFLEALAS